ncbi:hypothetical protein BJEO58_02759 [Brevibacterium jeotgali]|uniref:Uncharacterized protein n=2 Tax=Brevibacterium jeotgali TaxID=1262550 RepID=A0A2H1L8F5_9MICO|nr:hypothetical protein FB108_1456 [Brevibacterium jeotgali]SMY13149.1 hypothetical protein BJEO58_02759 [Brevibacterium jeotgali]
MLVFLSEELAAEWLHSGPLDSAEDMTARLADSARAAAKALQTRRIFPRVTSTRAVDRHSSHPSPDPCLVLARHNLRLAIPALMAILGCIVE